MTAPGLAVLTPAVGLPSETFVHRHATELAPGRTLTVSTRPSGAGSTWTVDPLLVLEGNERSAVSRRSRRVAARALGRAPGSWRWEPSRRDLDAIGRELDRAGVTVVLTEFLDTWLPLVPWLVRRGIRVFAHSHGRDVSVRLRDPWWAARYRDYAQADGVIAVSHHVRRRLVGLGLDPERIEIVPCGVEVPAGPPVRAPRADGTVHCVAIGRMVDKKAPLSTLEAFRVAAAVDDRLRLTMIGDGPLAPAVASAVTSWGLGGRVLLLGAQPHDVALGVLGGADVFVQHSVVAADGDEEGLPVAVLEAMAAAVPVVATRHAGIPEAVADGSSGLLVDEGDVAGMAEALVALAADPSMQQSFGAAGHAIARTRFSWERERDALQALLGLAPAAVG